MPARVLLTILSLSLLGFAPAPFPKAERRRAEGRTDVRGVWEFTACEISNTPYPRPITLFVAEITKDGLTFVGKNGGRNGSGYQLRLDPAAVPQSFSLSQNKQVVYVGSYRLQGDRLTMIFNSGTMMA